MLYTSAEADKLLKKLRTEEEFILNKESQSSFFNAAVGEDVESVRPDYDFEESTLKLDIIRQKIRKVKHAINMFNVTTKIDDMTIDEVLVLLPQLRSRVATLASMASAQPKVRVRAYGSGTTSIVDYKYANFDVAAVKREFDCVSEKLAHLQVELDKVNSTEMFDIDM